MEPVMGTSDLGTFEGGRLSPSWFSAAHGHVFFFGLEEKHGGGALDGPLRRGWRVVGRRRGERNGVVDDRAKEQVMIGEFLRRVLGARRAISRAAARPLKEQTRHENWLRRGSVLLNKGITMKLALHACVFVLGALWTGGCCTEQVRKEWTAPEEAVGAGALQRQTLLRDARHESGAAVEMPGSFDGKGDENQILAICSDGYRLLSPDGSLLRYVPLGRNGLWIDGGAIVLGEGRPRFAIVRGNNTYLYDWEGQAQWKTAADGVGNPCGRGFCARGAAADRVRVQASAVRPGWQAVAATESRHLP